MVEYITNHYSYIVYLFFQHILLTIESLVIAMIFALPAGFFLSKAKWITVPILAVLGVMYAIPSLALFALLIPVVGLGTTPAIIALVAYSQLILVRNVMVGFQSVNPSIVEAARGMGLSKLQLFWQIELPLALPVILGGIRIASISIIGIGTVAAWINAGGLGVLLFEGLYQNTTFKIVIGTCLVSCLAIISNQSLLWLEKRATLKARGEF